MSLDHNNTVLLVISLCYYYITTVILWCNKQWKTWEDTKWWLKSWKKSVVSFNILLILSQFFDAFFPEGDLIEGTYRLCQWLLQTEHVSKAGTRRSCMSVGHFLLRSSGRQADTRYFVPKKIIKMSELKIKHNRHFGSQFQSHTGGKTTTPSGVSHTHTQLLRNSYMTAFFSSCWKHLNYTLTQAKREDNWPGRSGHVSPDKLGSYPLHSQGAHTGPSWPLAPTASRQMSKSRFVIFQCFFFFLPPRTRIPRNEWQPVLVQRTQTACVVTVKVLSGEYL